MLALRLSVSRGASAQTGTSPAHQCAFCGQPAGTHASTDRCCALCTLVQQLDRPRIDEEVRLIWLPEMSQAALVCLVREMHSRLRSTGEHLSADTFPAVLTPERSTLHYARSALLARREVAAEHAGTSLASDLAHVLAHMDAGAYDRRHRLLAGLRALPTGRFFVGSEDVYPEVVDSWRQSTSPVSHAARSAA